MFIFKTPKALAFVLLVSVFISQTGLAYAAPRTNPFTIGQTIDPGAEAVEPCGPLDGNCFTAVLSAQDEGSTISNNVLRFNFVGAGVSATSTAGVVTVNIAGGGLSALTNGRIYIGNASNVPTEQTLTGDATLSNTGVLTILDANATTRGLVSTSTQTFAGNKTFNGDVSVLGNTNLATTTISSVSILNGLANLSGLTVTNATATNLTVTNLTVPNTLSQSGNTLTSNVGGSSATTSIVSNNTVSLSGSTLSSSVNGVVATTSLAGILASTTNTASSAGNVLTSTVNGVLATSSVITSNVATSSTNFLTTIVNGITSSIATIINSFTQTLTGNILTTTINGVVATSSVIGNNTISSSGNIITADVNGLIATTTAVNSNTLSFATGTGILTASVNGIVATTSIPGVATTTNALSFATGTNTLTSTVDGIATTTVISELTDLKLNATTTAQSITGAFIEFVTGVFTNLFVSTANFGNVTTGGITATSSLAVTGTSTLATTSATALSANSLNLSGLFFDSISAAGTAGQLLSSTGTSTRWVTLGQQIAAGTATSSTLRWNGSAWVENLGFTSDGTTATTTNFITTGAIAKLFGTTFATSSVYAHNVNFGNTSRVRVLSTDNAFLGITGIVAGSDGQELTLVNASSTSSFVLYNTSSASVVGNRIITGTGADITVPADASVQLVYDGASTVWRVVGGAGGSSSSFSSNDIANLPSGGPIGTAVATVDTYTNFNVNQTTTSQALTLPAPTDVTATKGKIITINNVGTANFSIAGVALPAGSYGSAFVWTGTAWNPINAASNVAAEYGETNSLVNSSVSGGLVSQAPY